MPRLNLVLSGEKLVETSWFRHNQNIIPNDKLLNDLAFQIEEHPAIRLVSLAMCYDALIKAEQRKFPEAHKKFIILRALNKYKEILDSFL